jgi:tripartite-type tricarboxylate transporter receptor subunit TctC
MKRRTILKAGAASSLPWIALRANAQAGSRPVRWVVPFTAGGPADLISRKLADLLGPDIGRPIIVDNKPGAAGVIAVQEVLKSDPDGSTLGLAGPDALISGPLIVSSAKYDARTDITKLMQVSYAHQVIWAHNSVGAATLTELVARAKAKPESISAVSWGPGSRAELVFKSLEAAYEAKFTNVPYRGIPQAMTDLMAGTVHIAHLPPNAAQQLQDKGAGVAVAVLGHERAAELPRTTSSVEQGINLPLLNAQMWNMVFGPRGMSAELTRRWVDALRKATASERFTEAMRAMSQIPMVGKYGETLEREFAAEHALISDVSRKSGLKVT